MRYGLSLLDIKLVARFIDIGTGLPIENFVLIGYGDHDYNLRASAWAGNPFFDPVTAEYIGPILPMSNDGRNFPHTFGAGVFHVETDH